MVAARLKSSADGLTAGVYTRTLPRMDRPHRAPGIILLPGKRPGAPYQLRVSMTTAEAEYLAARWEATGETPPEQARMGLALLAQRAQRRTG